MTAKILPIIGRLWRRRRSPLEALCTDDGVQDQMREAIQRAKDTVHRVIWVLDDPTCSMWSVKVPITDRGQTEHFWIRDISFENDEFTGIVDNEPETVTTVRLGQTLTVKKGDISDWTYEKHGKCYGNFTVRVLLQKMPKRQAKMIMAILADE